MSYIHKAGAVLGLSCALGLAGWCTPTSASAYFYEPHQIVGTGGDGVAMRDQPYQWAVVGNGPKADATVHLLCHEVGGPVGEHANQLWWYVEYEESRGVWKKTYVNDHWLDTDYSPNIHDRYIFGIGTCSLDSWT